MQRALQQREDEMQQEMLQKEKSYEKELNRINTEIHNLTQIKKSLEGALEDDKKKIEDLQKKLKAALDDVKKTKGMMQQQEKEHKQALADQEAALREKHSKALEKALAESKAQAQQLKAEFDRMQKLMNANVQQLEEKILEMERRYENRESREVWCRCWGWGGSHQSHLMTIWRQLFCPPPPPPALHFVHLVQSRRVYCLAAGLQHV